MPAKAKQRNPSRKNGGKSSQRSSSSRPSTTSHSRGRSKPQASFSLSAGLAELFSLTYFGQVILVLFVAALLIILNVLLSRNQSDLFFRLSGIEMILAAVIFWLIFLLKKE